MTATLDLFGPAMPSSRPLVAIPPLDLRVYQSEACEAVEAAHSRSRGALVVLPTGAGKTRVAAAVVRQHVLAGRRVLVLTPTITLCDQMYKDLWGYGLRDIGKEQADNRVRSPFPAVVVASVATMRGDRLQRFQPNTFGLVVGDEAHRAVSESQMAIFDYFWTAKRLGLTATPCRVDGISLANVFDETAYQMTMLQAIDAGWLVPIKFKTAITDFDAKALRTLGGDVTASSVESEIVRAGLLHEAANTLAELSAGERTVAFPPTVASSKAFVGELLARGVPAEHVDGTTPREMREEVFARFSAGETRVLSNVGICVEGWDCPTASVVALLNPTKSWSRLTQMIGRGTRLAPGKTHALVIDFCPGRLRKGRLASPADALAGRMLDDAVHEHLAKEGDLAKAIQDAERTVEDLEAKKQARAEAARRKAEKAAELAHLATKKQFTYGVQDHDAQDILGGSGKGDRGVSFMDSSEVTEEEKNTWRRKRGLCTEKQAKILAKHGLNPWMTRNLARVAMDAIAANGWTPPEEIKRDPRFYRKADVAPADLAEALLEQLKAG
jgi:superfamily II DNA or RNA helicase